MIYIVPVIVLFLVIVGYDGFDMQKVKGVGRRYLLHPGYWFIVFFRLIWEVALVGIPFGAANEYLKGNLAFSFPNVVGAAALTATVAIVSIWREEVASLGPRLVSPYGFFQVLKSYVTSSIVAANEERLRERTLRHKEWMISRFKTQELKAIFRRLYVQKHGPQSGREASTLMKVWRDEHKGDDGSYRKHIAEGIGEIARATWYQRILRTVGRGRFRLPKKRH